jgi:hypothetical protein
MAKELLIDLEKFKHGFYDLEDTTKAPFGALKVMKNATVTDRGGLSPRPGTSLLGTTNASSSKIKGFYNYRRSFGSDELLIKNYDDEMEALSKNNVSSDWFRVKDGLTADKEFGYITSLVNENNADYVVGASRFDNYFSWTGAVTLLNGALSGGETEVVVDSVLEPDVLFSGTAASASATTITVASQWATDQWNSFEVLITSGTHADKVRKITDTSDTTITFDTLGTSPGTATFEIRKLAYPESGSIIYAGTVIAYTTIVNQYQFPVTSAHAGSDNDPVTLIPTEYAANPRGNRLTNYLNRIMVGNVRSALARDSGGALQGYASGGSVFVSKINDPFDFTFAATRAAGEGDIISSPYGGGEITDVQHQEDNAYFFKERYIEAIQYSQDTNDVVVREPLKEGIGSVGKTIKASDDIYFMTPDKKFTSIGRVRTKDLKPQTENIGHPIKRFLDNTVVDEIGRGAEFKDKLHIPLKSNSTKTDNDIILIFNKKGFFEGTWDIPAFALDTFGDDLVYAESNGADVYKMYQDDSADVVGTTRHPIVSEVQTHFFNLASSNSSLQAMNGIYVEGYMRAGTTVTFKLWKDLETTEFFNFNFVSTEEGFFDGEESSASLGGNPLAIDPMTVVFSDPDADGTRHFSFRVYFPFVYGNSFSVGHTSNGVDLGYEITRYGLGIKEDISVNTSRIKSV